MKISNYNYIEVVDCNNDTITLKEYVKYIDNVERDISYRKINILHDKKDNILYTIEKSVT